MIIKEFRDKRLDFSFFSQDVLKVAPALIGKTLIRCYDDGRCESFIITETEAYRGEEDLACHASKGRTLRTEIMYNQGGYVYIYLIYGMYWMLNFVTGDKNVPQAVLIRGLDKVYGPGKLTKQLELDKSFYGENLVTSNRLFVCDSKSLKYNSAPRVGIDYAGEVWKNMPWRFTIDYEGKSRKEKV